MSGLGRMDGGAWSDSVLPLQSQMLGMTRTTAGATTMETMTAGVGTTRPRATIMVRTEHLTRARTLVSLT